MLIDKKEKILTNIHTLVSIKVVGVLDNFHSFSNSILEKLSSKERK
jgi:hypothetical protein